MPATPAQFLILDDALADVQAGDVIALEGDEGRHAARVARTSVGETVLLTDQEARQVRAETVAVGKDRLDVRLMETPQTPTPRRPRLALIQALATGGRDEQAVESATELGADRITPWIAERSVSVWRGEKLRKGRAKWENTVRAAVKQCRRPGIPTVDAAVDTAALVADVRARVADGGVVFVLHEQEQRPLMSLAEEIRSCGQAGECPEITVIVGPEGGISDTEISALGEAGARSVLLGPEVLRSSTAGPSALAVLSALLGRWGHPRGETSR